MESARILAEIQRQQPWDANRRNLYMQFMRRAVGYNEEPGKFVRPEGTKEYQSFKEKFKHRKHLTKEECEAAPIHEEFAALNWTPGDLSGWTENLPDDSDGRKSPFAATYRHKELQLGQIDWKSIVNCVLVHTDHLNNVPGQFIAEMNLDDIDKLEERWGSTDKVDEPFRDIGQCVAYLRLMLKEHPELAVGFAQNRKGAWSKSGTNNVCGQKVFDAWCNDYVTSSFMQVKGTQRRNQKYNTVKNDWMKMMILRFFFKEFGLQDEWSDKNINAGKAGDMFEYLMGFCIENKHWPFVSAIMVLLNQLEGLSIEARYEVDLHEFIVKGGF